MEMETAEIELKRYLTCYKAGIKRSTVTTVEALIEYVYFCDQ